MWIAQVVIHVQVPRRDTATPKMWRRGREDGAVRAPPLTRSVRALARPRTDARDPSVLARNGLGSAAGCARSLWNARVRPRNLRAHYAGDKLDLHNRNFVKRGRPAVN